MRHSSSRRSIGLRCGAALALIAALSSCRSVVDPPGTTQGVIQVVASSTTDTADARRVVTITATIDTAARPADNTVTFTSTTGSFQGAASPGTTLAVRADERGLATAQLIAPADSSTAIVTATAGGVSRAVSVLFVPAPATRLEVTTDKFTLQAKASDAVIVTVKLLRTFGTASPGAIVTFSADSAGGTSGTFGSFSASSVLATSNQVTVQYTVGATTYRGPVTIRATSDRGARPGGSTTITIVTPTS